LGNNKAIAFGPGFYRSKDINDIPPTANDAINVGKILKHGGYDVEILTERQATLGNLKDKLKKMARQASPQGTSIIFLSTHGGNYAGTTYLLTHDTDLNDLVHTALSGTEFSDILETIGTLSGRLVVFIDTCFALDIAHLKGNSTDSTQPASVQPAPLTKGYISHLADGKGRVVIASSDGNSFSHILVDHDMSFFTEYLVQGLEQSDLSGDGYIHILDLFKYISNAMRSQTIINQYPLLDARHVQVDFPIIRVLPSTISRHSIQSASASGSQSIQKDPSQEHVNMTQQPTNRDTIGDISNISGPVIISGGGEVKVEGGISFNPPPIRESTQQMLQRGKEALNARDYTRAGTILQEAITNNVDHYDPVETAQARFYKVLVMMKGIYPRRLTDYRMIQPLLFEAVALHPSRSYCWLISRVSRDVFAFLGANEKQQITELLQRYADCPSTEIDQENFAIITFIFGDPSLGN
jgi:Caspase domain